MTDFIEIVTFCKRAPKVTESLVYFCKKIWHQDNFKIAQSGHTAHEPTCHMYLLIADSKDQAIPMLDG